MLYKEVQLLLLIRKNPCFMEPKGYVHTIPSLVPILSHDLFLRNFYYFLLWLCTTCCRDSHSCCSTFMKLCISSEDAKYSTQSPLLSCTSRQANSWTAKMPVGWSLRD